MHVPVALSASTRPSGVGPNSCKIANQITPSSVPIGGDLDYCLGALYLKLSNDLPVSIQLVNVPPKYHLIRNQWLQ